MHFFYKTIKTSSLTEVMVATTILLVVFGIALGTLSNLMMQMAQKDTQYMNAKLEKLIYFHSHQQRTIPTSYTEGTLSISIQKNPQKKGAMITFSITDTLHNQRLVKKRLCYETD